MKGKKIKLERNGSEPCNKQEEEEEGGGGRERGMKEGRSEGGREGSRRHIALNMFNKTGRISKIILEKRKYDKNK